MHNMMVHYCVEIMKEDEKASLYFNQMMTEVESPDPTSDAVEALMILSSPIASLVGDSTTRDTCQHANIANWLSEQAKNEREWQFMVESWLTLNDKNAHAQLTGDIIHELNQK